MMKKETLSNGLTVLGEEISWCNGAAIGFFVKTGARDEQPHESGVSHFLEHMLFKGTDKRSAIDLTFDMGNIGAKANAFTSEENTVYYASVVGDVLPTMQEILSDMMRPKLDPAEFDMERKVILEEIALYQDRPQFWFFEQAMKRYFHDHPAGNSILGTPDSINALSVETMRNYFDRRYSPSNMALVVTGKFDWNDIIEAAKDLCGEWENFEADRVTTQFLKESDFFEFRRAELAMAHVLLSTQGPTAQEDERYELSILSTVLGDSVGSKLFWELVDTGLAETAVTDNETRDGVGVFSGYASCAPERLEEVAEKLRSVLEKKESFSDGELVKAKNKMVSRLVLNGESPMGRLMSLGSTWNSQQRVYTLEEVISRVKSVSRESIMSALEKYPLETWSEYRLLPEEH